MSFTRIKAKILPPDEESEDYYKEFWNAYVTYNRIPPYLQEITSLEFPIKEYWDELTADSSFWGKHLQAAYVLDASSLFGPGAVLKVPARSVEVITSVAVDRSHYPHSCPFCGSPAHIGSISVDCSSCKGEY